MGRPPTKPKRFKDGFYIEVRNKGANAGMKIHFDTHPEMQSSAEMYRSMSKEVVILGQHKKDVWLDIEPPAEEKKRKARAERAAEKAEKAAEKMAEKAAKKAAAQKPTKKEKAVKPAKKTKVQKAKSKPQKVKAVKKAKPAVKAKAKKKK